MRPSHRHDIHFDPWVTNEFQAHIHVKFPPEIGGEAIWTDLPAGPDKVGGVALEPSDALAFHEGRMFVLVHTLTHLTGEVRGFIVPEVAARPATWGGLKAIDRRAPCVPGPSRLIFHSQRHMSPA